MSKPTFLNQHWVNIFLPSFLAFFVTAVLTVAFTQPAVLAALALSATVGLGFPLWGIVAVAGLLLTTALCVGLFFYFRAKTQNQQSAKLHLKFVDDSSQKGKVGKFDKSPKLVNALESQTTPLLFKKEEGKVDKTQLKGQAFVPQKAVDKEKAKAKDLSPKKSDTITLPKPGDKTISYDELRKQLIKQSKIVLGLIATKQLMEDQTEILAELFKKPVKQDDAFDVRELRLRNLSTLHNAVFDKYKESWEEFCNDFGFSAVTLKGILEIFYRIAQPIDQHEDPKAFGNLMLDGFIYESSKQHKLPKTKRRITEFMDPGIFQNDGVSSLITYMAFIIKEFTISMYTGDNLKAMMHAMLLFLEENNFYKEDFDALKRTFLKITENVNGFSEKMSKNWVLAELDKWQEVFTQAKPEYKAQKPQLQLNKALSHSQSKLFGQKTLANREHEAIVNFRLAHKALSTILDVERLDDFKKLAQAHIRSLTEVGTAKAIARANTFFIKLLNDLITPSDFRRAKVGNIKALFEICFELSVSIQGTDKTHLGDLQLLRRPARQGLSFDRQENLEEVKLYDLLQGWIKKLHLDIVTKGDKSESQPVLDCVLELVAQHIHIDEFNEFKAGLRQSVQGSANQTSITKAKQMVDLQKQTLDKLNELVAEHQTKPVI